MGRETRRLGDDGGVHVSHRPAGVAQHPRHLLQQADAHRPGKRGVVRAEEAPDIAKRRRAEQRVHDGVRERVSVGMSLKPEVVWHRHAA